jgi:hypothetical protein
MLGSTAGQFDSCLLANKLKDFEAAGFVVKEGHKSIHDKDSIRFMREVIGAGKWQMEVLSNGLSLDLKEVPRKYKEQNNMSAVKNMPVLKEKVKEWEEEGYVERLSEPSWCCNPMSVAAKYDPVKDETKLRPCIDLSRHVNKCVRDSHAKLDDLTVAQELISKDDFMASFDLANQFFHVKLHEADKKFFGFELPGKNGEPEYYRFTVMAYGYSPAVEVVTRLLRPVKAYLHQLGIKLSLYVDDGRVSASSKEKTWSQFQFVLTVLQLCGWNIQWKKTSTEAVQQLQHLGFITDSVQLRYWLPKEKEDLAMDMLQSTISRAMEGRKVTALDLAKLLGRLNSMRRSHGSLPGVLTRTCQHLLGVAVNTYGWRSRLLLTYEAVRELLLLKERLRGLNGQHIFSCEARKKVVSLAENDRMTERVSGTEEDMNNLYVSDASDSHAYIYKADGQFQYVKEFEFSVEERLTSSGCRELLAVQKSLQADPAQFKAHKGGTIFWQTDSKNCYGFLVRGSRQPEIQKIVTDIKCRERRLDIRIVPVWTPRTQARIVTADLGSKMSSSTDEWCVDREDLARMFTEMDYRPEFDCMASRRNAICEKYFSKIPQIGSSGVNFLAQNLSPNVNYFCCPPVKMIGRAVCHILDAENVTCLFLVPVWSSAAYWPALQLSPRFREATRKEFRFSPRFFMSNGAKSLFSRCPRFEMAAFLLNT